MSGTGTRRGSALLIVLGMVAFMVVSAVGFSVFMRNNRIPSSHLRRSTASRELAKAALANAMAEIENAVNENPYPGVGDKYVVGRESNSRNIWYGRVLFPIPKDAGNANPDPKLVGPSNTVSVLTLEGLAYLPPAIINDVRYLSRRTPTAQWRRLDFDAGRYAFCAIDVSDFFDIGGMRFDVPRGSADENLISLSYLFEVGNDRKWDKVKPLEFQGELDSALVYDRSKREYTNPLVSLADYNLVVNGIGNDDFPSPFCEALGKGSDIYASFSPGKDSWDYLKYAVQRFVTDVHPGRSREEWFDEAANRYRLLDDEGNLLDLTKREHQPFPDLLGGDDEGKNDITAEDVTTKKSSDFFNRRSGQIKMCEAMALYDYLDRDDVPLTLAAPTVDRAPMIVAVEVDPDSGNVDRNSICIRVAKDAPPPEQKTQPSANGMGTTVTYRRTVTFFPQINQKADGVDITKQLKFRVGLAYPFKYRREQYEGLKYEAQVIAKLYPVNKKAVWEPNNADHGCRTSVNGAFGKFDKATFDKIDKNGGVVFDVDAGVLTLASRWNETQLPDTKNKDTHQERFIAHEEEAVSQKPGKPFHDIVLTIDSSWFKGCNAELKEKGFIARYNLKREVQQGSDGRQTVLNLDKENLTIDGEAGWIFDEDGGKNPEADTGALRALQDDPFLSAEPKELDNGDEYVWGMSLAVRLREAGSDMPLVDMAPAHMVDDENPPSEGSRYAQYFGYARGRPVLRFDDKTAQKAAFTMPDKTKLEEYTKLDEVVARQDNKEAEQRVVLSPKAYYTDDPRYNYAAENWCPVDEIGDTVGESLGRLWLSYATCDGKANRDGDIFMSVSNQGYLQDPGELAFLPRVAGFSGENGFGYEPVQNAMHGKIPDYSDDKKVPNFAQVANKAQMWRTYSCFGRMDGNQLHPDEIDNLCIISPVRGYRANPYSNDELIRLAPFVNTPYDWWAAGTNWVDKVDKEGKMLVKVDESGRVADDSELLKSLKYTFGPHGGETYVPHTAIQKIAKTVSGALHSGNNAWYRNWGDSGESGSLKWLDYGSGSTKLLDDDVELQLPLHDIDMKFLCSYWRKCYSNAQQLFIVFFRSEPVIIGGGSGDGNAPPQLSARGVAVVWRDPNAADGRGSTAYDRRPHAMRVLFYHQFE